jgi:hypothetical protein
MNKFARRQKRSSTGKTNINFHQCKKKKKKIIIIGDKENRS